MHIIPKKDLVVLSELERSIAKISTIEDSKNLLFQFEQIEEEIRDKYFPVLYMQMWKVALNAGKLSLANSYAKKSLQYLIDYKRIPQIKVYIQIFKDAGLFKNKFTEYFIMEEILLGKKNNINSEVIKEHIELLLHHSDHWKENPEFLKQYLLIEDVWGQELWKTCYEFILYNYFDRDIFLVLLDKAGDYKDKEYERKLQALLSLKKIKVPGRKMVDEKNHRPTKEKLNIDYDQIAMDFLSGIKEPNDEDQRRVINSLKYIPEDELSSKGQEMIIAFELLGMEQVVLALCETMIGILTDVKQRSSTYYVWTQALINLGEFYKAIDLIDEVLVSEPLYGEERLAFLYVKAEACLKLNKVKMAKELYSFIKKQNPNYRLVKERLKAFDKN